LEVGSKCPKQHTFNAARSIVRICSLSAVAVRGIYVKVAAYLWKGKSREQRSAMSVLVVLLLLSKHQCVGGALAISTGIPTKISTLTALFCCMAGLNFHRLKASVAASSISATTP
jgi:hypothetical protein